MIGGLKPPATVIGGNANAVSVTRSLGRRGVDVTVYGGQHPHLRHSRFCSTYVDAGSAPGIADRWLRHLLHHPDGSVLLPCDDQALGLIARHRGQLERAGYRPFEADDEVVLAMLDKSRTYQVARSARIPVPWTIPLTDASDLDRVHEEIGFPCALKPVHSHAFARIYRNRKAFIAGSRKELRQLWAETSLRGLTMVATEIIPGGDDRLCSYYAYIDEDGRPLVELTKRKIRQYPTGFGLGSYEITDDAPDVRRAGAAFFRAAGIRGLANVEFKRDPRDGVLRLIECNHRFTASNELIRAAGIDLAWLSYARVAGLELPRLDRYRTDVTLWNPLRDLRGVVGPTIRGETTLASWLPGLLRRQILPVFAWDDPGPTLAYHLGLAGRLPSRLAMRAVTSRAASPS